jgi:transcriptional repressor NrdR
MRCPKCGSLDDRVVDSRIQREGGTIRRRRECVTCGHRYSTLETILREGLVVVKRDGRREEFDRNKILNGLRKACEKRQIQAEQLNLLIDDVLADLEARYDDEIPSEMIGELVMHRLVRLDKVAYLRYASVYKEFGDIADFLNEARALERPPARVSPAED